MHIIIVASEFYKLYIYMSICKIHNIYYTMLKIILVNLSIFCPISLFLNKDKVERNDTET